jgi:hypothetical protein
MGMARTLTYQWTSPCAAHFLPRIPE